MSLPKFKIGQVAEMFGITAETLRHYERKGLIKPIEIKNSYRYYDMPTTGEIAAIRLYLSYGYTLDEIAHILHSEDLNEIADTLETQAQKIEREILEQMEQLRSMRKLQSNIHRSNQIMIPRLSRRPAFYLSEVYEDAHIVENEDTLRICAEMLKFQPYGGAYLLYSLEELRDGVNDVPHCGVAVPCDEWDRVHDYKESGFKYLPECPAIHIVRKMEPFDGPVIDLFEEAFTFAEEKHLEITGDILAITASSRYYQEKFEYYRDIWIPVKNPLTLK